PDDGRRSRRYCGLSLLRGSPWHQRAGHRARRRRSPGMIDRDLASEAEATARKLASIAAAGEDGRVNRRLIRGLADEGLLPRLFPRRAGGSREGEVSAVDLCVVREALGRESTLAENAVAIQTLGAYPIVLGGTPEQAGRYAGPVARGEAVAAFALTEPEAGTDAAALALRAERDGNGYRLTGTKAFISNAPDADVYTLFARTTADAAIAHASNRKAFGRPIKEFQAVSHQLAEMATKLEAARALVYAAAEAYDRGDQDIARRSAMAKLFATETAQQVIDVAIQVHGAVALERGHLLEHLYREVRAPRIYEGTSEIQREIIARDLFRADRPNVT